MKKHAHRKVGRCALFLLYELAVGRATAPPTIAQPTPREARFGSDGPGMEILKSKPRYERGGLRATVRRTRSLSEQRKTTMRLLSPNILGRPTVILPRPKLPT